MQGHKLRWLARTPTVLAFSLTTQHLILSYETISRALQMTFWMPCYLTRAVVVLTLLRLFLGAAQTVMEQHFGTQRYD